MRLREIYYILEKNKPRLTYTQSPSPGTQNTNLSGLTVFRDAINEVAKTGIMKDAIKTIQSSVIFSSNRDAITIMNTDYSPIIAPYSKLVTFVNEFIETLDNILTATDANSFFIKFPPVKDFNQLAKVAEKIQVCIEQAIVNDTINGQIKIENVENGSIWFELSVGGPVVVGLIGSLAWSAAVIYKKIQEGKLLHQQVETYKVKKENLDAIKDGVNETIKLMLTVEAEIVYNEYFKPDNPDKNEQVLRLKETIKTFSELIEEGAEIAPALNAPENVSNLFPDLKKMTGIESRTKKIAP